MASRHDTMMNPPIEGLLDRAGSKFTLVTLGAKRARQINSYYNQLSEGLGSVVPPQVSSSARKPLSIAFEEIDADKILGVWPEPESEVDPDAPTEGTESAEWPAPPSTAMLEGKRIVLGVSGGIAAYKAVEVCRRLVDAGAHVIPVLTEGSLHFVGRTTFDALGSERAWTSLWDEPHPIPHTHLGQMADLVLVAPATARVLGLYAAGISDDLLLNVLLATRAPVMVCPAMHTEMWEHPAVQDNLRVLHDRGVHVVEPAVGRLAGGDVGAGRLAEPEDIVDAVEELLAAPAHHPTSDLAGVRAIVTAGGTREPIDPVRFIGNRSSGKQGHAVAEEAAARGAKVTLVTTTSIPTSAGIDVVRVNTAAEMEQAVLSRSDDAELIVMAAAVADFRPVKVADSKIKKAGGLPDVVLEPTNDILAALGAARRPGQTIVGFAAETDDLRANAAEKLARKGIDLIVANDVSAPGVGFEHDTNAVVILDSAGGARDVPLTDKRAIARAILDAVSTTRSDS